jgi:hypothetical protein
VGWDNQDMDVLSLGHGSPSCHNLRPDPTLHPNVRVPEATGPGYSRVRKGNRFVG